MFSVFSSSSLIVICICLLCLILLFFYLYFFFFCLLLLLHFSLFFLHLLPTLSNDSHLIISPPWNWKASYEKKMSKMLTIPAFFFKKKLIFFCLLKHERRFQSVFKNRYFGLYLKKKFFSIILPPSHIFY